MLILELALGIAFGVALIPAALWVLQCVATIPRVLWRVVCHPLAITAALLFLSHLLSSLLSHPSPAWSGHSVPPPWP